MSDKWIKVRVLGSVSHGVRTMFAGMVPCDVPLHVIAGAFSADGLLVRAYLSADYAVLVGREDALRMGFVERMAA